MRFLEGKLDFAPDESQFLAPDQARRLLAVLGAVLLQNRSRIKSIVIEGHAAPGERNAWVLSQGRAETVRQLWAQSGLLGDVDREKPLPCIAFLKGAGAWNPLFGSWHREEYQARRVAAPGQNGVLPQAWIITAGRGDQMRRQSVVEFKVEFTLNSPLDDVLDSLPASHRARAVAQNLILQPRAATSRRTPNR